MLICTSCRPGPRPDQASCQNLWLAKIGLVEIPKHGEDDVEDNEGFQPEEVFRMEEKQAREDENKTSNRKK